MASEYLAPNEEIVAGVYPLGALIRRSVAGAIYETEFGEGEATVPAAIRIREIESTDAEYLSQRLRTAAQLAHPNLLKIYAGGSSILNGVPVFYAVMERADESLEGVLAERALTENETREMLAPALEALDYLHKNGYAHSRLKPSNVLAVNDRLKLSSDSVVRANNDEAAEDMRALGILIVQALTQKSPHEGWESQDFEGIPQPLADIIRHCLDPDRATRWTAEQVKVCLNPPAIALERIVDDPDPHDSKTRVPMWIYVGLAALILIVVLAAAVRKNHPAPVPATVVAESPRPEAPPDAVTQAVAPHPTRKASGWSVIVGAYRSRELAEKRMRDLAKRWPKFQISVLASQSEKSSYLVVLGRDLSEDQAEALRKRAVQSGWPGDTYIKRM